MINDKNKGQGISMINLGDRVVVDRDGIYRQLEGLTNAEVRHAYLTLAEATLPEGMTVRPSSHGFIKKELRFEMDDAWLFSAVLNTGWILWYFRRPAIRLDLVSTEATLARFPESNLSTRGEIKLRIRNRGEAEDVARWIGARPLPT